MNDYFVSGCGNQQTGRNQSIRTSGAEKRLQLQKEKLKAIVINTAKSYYWDLNPHTPGPEIRLSAI